MKNTSHYGLIPIFLAFCVTLFTWPSLAIAALTNEEVASRITPPMTLGPRVAELAAWELRAPGGSLAGYVFETAELAPIPGFSGMPIDLLVAMNTDGTFLDIQLISQNEPVFVSGLGVTPLKVFLEQYQGKNLGTTIKVGSANGGTQRDDTGTVYVDGVSKATASVRIVNESILAAALKVAKALIGGVSSSPPAEPRKDITESMDWQALIKAGLVTHRRILNRDVEAAFAGTDFAGQDPQALADPDGLYAEVWIADLSVPSTARSLLAESTLAELAKGNAINTYEEGILLLSRGRHPLLDKNFIRNTMPDRISAVQSGYPLALRDADIEAQFLPDVAESDHRIVLRFDKRLGFDPGSPWTLQLKAVRLHGSFMPEIGTALLDIPVNPPERFYQRPQIEEPEPVWLSSWRDNTVNLILLVAMLTGLIWAMAKYSREFSLTPQFKSLRMGILIITLVFIGWYGQAQLSIVNLLGVIRALVDGSGLAYLLYDPMTLVLWAVVLLTLPLWGRGLFCGWLCPYGALQEFAYILGRWLRLPRLKIPEHWDQRLKHVKYIVLAALITSALFSWSAMDSMVEVEPFKTAITLGFDRAVPFILYAALWLVLGLFFFKGFCRYLCPLGGALAVLGRLRRWDWITRRTECGSPCQLCRVRCHYNAIERSGKIDYDECFACLDCVTIYHDEKRCVPLIIQAKKARKANASH